MKKRSLHNRRGIVWLLSVAFVLMAMGSGASWQCLDGHPCPPGCTMLHMREKTQAKGSSSPHACCVQQDSANAGTAHCAFCSTARSTNTQMEERCTSPICVLRIQAKPDVTTQAHIHFVFDTAAILLPVIEPVLIPEATGSVSFGSSRAPPDQVVIRLSSPRAPPVWLI